MPPIQRRQSRVSRVANNLQGIIDVMLKSKIQEDSQKRQADYVSERQRDHDERMIRSQEAARAFEQAQGNRESFQSLFDTTDKATTLEEVPTASGLIARGKQLGQADPHFQGGGPVVLGQQRTAMPDVAQPTPIHELLQARQAKQAAIEQELRLKQAEKPRLGSDQVMGFNDRSGAFLPTERSGQQEGERDSAQALAGDLSPGVIAANARKTAASESAGESATINARYGLRDKLGAIAQETATGVGRGLGAVAQDRLTGTGASLNMIGQMREGLKKFGNEIGPIAHLAIKWELGGPLQEPRKELAEWVSRIATLQNNIIKAQTGAQMSQGEAERILKQVPDINMHPTVFAARLDVTEENLKFMESRIKQLAGQGVPEAVQYIKENGLQFLEGTGPGSGGAGVTMQDYNDFMRQYGQ
jgi:hypothetical protein